MPQATKNEHRKCRKPKSESKPHYSTNANESRNSFLKNHKKKMGFLFRGLGCKGASLTASAPEIIRSAAGWEAKNSVKRNQKKLRNRRNQGNVADVCCAPPGIGISSDFPTRTRNAATRSDHRKRCQVTRRNEDGSGPRISAILAGGIGSRTNHRSAGEIIETMLLQQNLLSGRVELHLYDDRYEDWRLNVDNMSYEELLDLGDKMGYVGRGLHEEEIYSCLNKPKPLNHAAKDWRCSICQEKCRGDDDIGTLDCGHHHHVECIKQWLLQRNACPVCKSQVLMDWSRTRS